MSDSATDIPALHPSVLPPLQTGNSEQELSVEVQEAPESRGVGKKSSFQITSVTTVGSSSVTSNDGGDESDLEEPRTEDSLDAAATDGTTRLGESRIISQSHEDKLVSGDVFYNNSSSAPINTVPVIPTSSQFGLAVCTGTGAVNMNQFSEGGSGPVMALSSATLVNPEGLLSDERNESRFKVVKIVSTEPFKRGRWVCMDYFDQTTTKEGQGVGVSPSSVRNVNGPSNISQPTMDTGSNQRTEPARVPDSRVNGDITQPYLIQHDTQGRQNQQQQAGSSSVVPQPQPAVSSPSEAYTNQNAVQIPSQNSPTNISQAYPPQQCQQQQYYVPASSVVSGSGVMQNSTLQRIPHQLSQAAMSIPQSQGMVNPTSTQINVQNGGSILQQGIHQAQPQQQQYAPAQSLPHGSHAAAMAAASTPIGIPPATTTNGPVVQPQAVQRQHTTQSWGHNNTLQQSIPNFVPSGQGQMDFHQATAVRAQQQEQAFQQSQQAVPQSIIPQQSQLVGQDQLSQGNYQYSNQQPIPNQHLQQIQPCQNISQVYSSPPLVSHQIPLNLQMGIQQQPQLLNQQQHQQLIQQQMQQQAISQSQVQANQMAGVGMVPTLTSQPMMHQSVVSQPHIPQTTQILNHPQMVSPQGITHGAPIQSNVGQQQVIQNLPTQSYSQPQTQTQLQGQQFVQHFNPQQQASIAGQTQAGQQSFSTPPLTQQNQPPVAQVQNMSYPPQHLPASGVPTHSQQQQPPLYYQQQISGNYNTGVTLPQMTAASSTGPQQQVSAPLVTGSYSDVGSGSSGLPTETKPQSISIAASTSPQQTTSGSGTPQQQPPVTLSLAAAANVIVEGIHSVVKGMTTATTGSGSDGNESASGTNTVAIDNKIEQAMDLVKSHLMFAVREEVEVLKEKITELMERITQLEEDNSILRANASPEVLAQLKGQFSNNLS